MTFSIRQKIILILFVGFTLFNLRVIFKGQEFFPFSTNPMFGHYLMETDTLYTIDFYLKSKSGELTKIDIEQLGFFEVRLKRFYFSSVYGSSEQNSPQNYFINDNSQAFERRNSKFFNNLMTYVEKEYILDHQKYISLVIKGIDKENETLFAKQIGLYDIESSEFTHMKNEIETTGL